MRVMAHNWTSIFCASLLGLAAACSTPEAGDDGDEAGDGASSTSGDGDESGSESGGDMAGTETAGNNDDGNAEGECQFGVENDCISDELKCMPWSEKPDRIPDAAKCCPVDPNPVSLGDRCEVQEYDGSCLDNCPIGSTCVVDDIDNLEGFCQVYCDAGDPEGCAPNEVCKPFFEMIEAAETVPLCMARCDPLAQDCESKGRAGWTCLPEGAFAPEFLCMPPPAGEAKLEYDGCLLQNDCEIGLACVPASEVLGCDSFFNCCTRYCDLNEPDSCTLGNECISLESDVPGLENVGVCADPV